MSKEGDVVLIYYLEQPTVFARIEHIRPDVKKDWYQATFLFLTLPTQTVTWILRGSYINGAPFTMDGKNMRLEEVKKISAEQDIEQPVQSPENKASDKKATVIPLRKL
ncbi:MAG: hypothetical protein GY864_04985 [Desulfobacterales bacterium]|nr:hypothetical protein [Desulfobacterales bacterium]